MICITGFRFQPVRARELGTGCKLQTRDTQMFRRMWHVVIPLALLMVIAGGGIWVWKFQTYHLATVDRGKLYRDGNRGPREFANMVRLVKPR